MRYRIFPENNYFAIWKEGIAVRFQIEDDKPITELKYPEFYDVKITGYCTGKCPWCYQDSKESSEHYDNILFKVASYFGYMTMNERPFQIALGGGNPNQHPDFCDLVEIIRGLGITPNYTTNGIGMTPEVIEATKKYCGGVAISTHPHLQYYWTDAFWRLHDSGFENLVLQTIISDKQSIDYFADCQNIYRPFVKYHVLLPYEAMGRAEPKEIDYPYLEKTLDKIGDRSKLAFGANFYPWLQTTNYEVMLYEPEIMSKFLDLKDMKLYKSSFNLEEV